MIDVTATKDGKEATLAYDFGDNLEAAVEKFGAEIVFTNFRANAKIGLQAAMRSRLVKGGDVQGLASIWKPGVQLERSSIDPKEAAKMAFANMTKEERDAFLNDLMSM